MSITKAVIEILLPNRDNFLNQKNTYFLIIFYAIFCDNELGISCLSIFIISNVQQFKVFLVSIERFYNQRLFDN